MNRRLLLLTALAAFGALLVFASRASSDEDEFITFDGNSLSTPCIRVPPNGEHWMEPGCEGISRVGQQSAVLKFNSYGLRDKDYAPLPSKGKLRILVLGSSNVLGLGIEEQSTYPRRLEHELMARGLNVEVINGAMVGYCVIQSTFRYRELLKKYSPHLVIYQWVQGSCPLFDGAWSSRVEWEAGAPVRFNRAPTQGAFPAMDQFVFRNPSVFFTWLVVADQLKKALFSWKVALLSGQEEKLAAVFAPTLPYLNFMKKEAEAQGASILLVSHHMKSFYQSVPAQMNYSVARILSHLMIPFDLKDDFSLPIFAAQSGFETLLPDFDVKDFRIPGDEHLSKEGDHEFARLTAELLLGSPSMARAKNAKGRPRN